MPVGLSPSGRRRAARRPLADAVAAILVVACVAPAPRVHTTETPPAPPSACAATTDSAQRVAVRAALDTFITDFNNLEDRRFAERWSDSASAVLPFADTPGRLDGRAAVLERFRRYFAQVRLERTGPPYLRMVVTDVRIDLLAERHALVAYAFAAGGTVQRRTLVMGCERDGAWRIRHLHGSAHP